MGRIEVVAAEHLAEVKNFMDGKQAREERRITRDLAARINPVHFAAALAATLPHIAKDSDSGNHNVGVIFTRKNILTVASAGWTAIVCKTPVSDDARVTGDVVADSIILTPAMAKQLMGFAALVPKESWKPELEIEVTGTGPDKTKIRASDRTGLFAGKSLTLPVQDATENLARTMQILESMARSTPEQLRTYDPPADRLASFITSAKKWETDFDVESIGPALWRVNADELFYGLMHGSAGRTPSNDEAKIALADSRRKNRDSWSLELAGVGQELVKEFSEK